MLQILRDCRSIGGQTLFIIDVESLCTSMPPSVGSERARMSLTRHTTGLAPMAINLLTGLLKLQLEQNFMLEDKKYTHTHGVAMGGS